MNNNMHNNFSAYSASEYEEDFMYNKRRMKPMDNDYDKLNLMKQIYTHGLVLTEAALYLDTHPSDPEALNYYNEMNNHYQQFVAKYSELFGPLNLVNAQNEDYWMWVATPMPWEMEGC